MTYGKRTALALALAGAMHGLGLPAAQAQTVEPHADELSSVKWRDCAGHFFFLAKMMGASEDKAKADQFKSWGILAVYAGETKAKAEAKAGDTSKGRGQSMLDSESGKLKVDVEGMIGDHAGKAEKQGQNEYVQAYAKQCGKPIQAYSKRFMDSVEARKKQQSKEATESQDAKEQ